MPFFRVMKADKEDPREQIRARLRAAGARFDRSRQQNEADRDALHPLVVEALQAGLVQAEVVELSGYTRTTVRTLARSAGIGPAKVGRRRRDPDG